MKEELAKILAETQNATDLGLHVRIAIPNTLPTMTYQAAEGRLVGPNEPCTARIYRAIWTPQPAKEAAKQDPKPSADAAVGKT